MEGLSAAGNIQGAPADALVSILKFHGIRHVLKWVDNFCIFQTPIIKNGPSPLQYTFDISSILSITDPLGIPWHPIEMKGQNFATTVPYVGFIWDLANHSVSLSAKKRIKYIGKVTAFQALAKGKVTRKECMSIHGTLQHITFVYKDGHSTLPPFSTFLAKFPNDYARHHIPKSVSDSLLWWVAILSNPSCSCSLLPRRIIDPNVWVDASTSWGIGVIIGERWSAWRLLDGWKADGRDIGWAEAIALEMAILWLIHKGYSDWKITIHGDNTGVIGAYEKGHSRNIPRNDSLRRISSCIIPNNIVIAPVYVKSAMNKADPISRGILGLPHLRFRDSIQLPVELIPFIAHAQIPS